MNWEKKNDPLKIYQTRTNKFPHSYNFVPLLNENVQLGKTTFQLGKTTCGIYMYLYPTLPYIYKKWFIDNNIMYKYEFNGDSSIKIKFKRYSDLLLFKLRWG